MEKIALDELVNGILAIMKPSVAQIVYDLFCNTTLYEVLQIEESLMWSESTEYIVDEYYRRQEAGTIYNF